MESMCRGCSICNSFVFLFSGTGTLDMGELASKFEADEYNIGSQ